MMANQPHDGRVYVLNPRKENHEVGRVVCHEPDGTLRELPTLHGAVADRLALLMENLARYGIGNEPDWLYAEEGKLFDLLMQINDEQERKTVQRIAFSKTVKVSLDEIPALVSAITHQPLKESVLKVLQDGGEVDSTTELESTL